MTHWLQCLCRDTTVQSLTLQPNVQDGVIIYEDSPLVSCHVEDIVWAWESSHLPGDMSIENMLIVMMEIMTLHFRVSLSH